MAKIAWPPAAERALIGKRIDRVDGPAKATGTARYTYDVHRPGLLYAILVPCLHAKARIVAVHGEEAERLQGVRAVWIDTELKESNYAGQIVAAVAADTEEIAREAAARVRIECEVQAHQVDDTDPGKAEGRPALREAGNVAEAMAQADATVTGEYGLAVITHCCLEPHGQVAEVRDDELFLWPSTQNVSRYFDPPFAESTGFPANKIHVDCQHMGGGFGSKFGYDKWGTIGALLAKKTGRPVKLMLDRDLELMIAGSRPSAFSRIKIGAKRDGTVTAIDAEIWGTGGTGGYNAPPVPYVFTKIPNTRHVGKGIRTNRGGQRAWRAPNHPQGCFLTMAAFEDMAAALRMDALEFLQKNLQFTDRPEVYAEELKIAADMIGYARKAHLRGDPTPGPIKRGLGLAIHTWGGRGHPSECEVTLNPDGSVAAKIGTQDLGVGTRTAIGIVIGETLGLPLDAIDVHIGRNEYPLSGASGGSTTIGGISVSSRMAATAALNALFDVVGPRLGVAPDDLEAVGGQIRRIGHPTVSVGWRDACAMLRTSPITKRGENNPGESERAGLTSANVGGVQIAEVAVDIETGVVTLEEMVAVQDCGLIIDLKTAESQVFGSLIMGITYSLYEEAIYDRATGRMLNADMEFYRLAGIKDIGRLKVHMMTGKGYDERGVIGLGEPPVISPGAAISNAVANACGVRVPDLPITPDRVLAALQKGGNLA